MSYSHLAMDERNVIYRMQFQGYSHVEIARCLGCHRATIGREGVRPQGSRAVRRVHEAELSRGMAALNTGVLSAPSPVIISGRMNAFTVDLQDVRVVRLGHAILAGISLHVEAARCCAVLGPNGSGKSTLVSVLSGYTWPSTGSVNIGGQVFGKVDLACVRRGIGLIEPSRSPALDEQMRVREVVATGLFGTIRLPLHREVEPAQWRRVEAEIDSLGLGGVQDSVFAQLSTGEQMKTLLARAMVAEAGLLLLDEPTAGLDMGARAACVGVLERLLNRPQHPTVIIVSHHLDELPCQVDQVVLLKQGAVFAAGTAEQALTSEKLSALFDCRIEVFKNDGRYVAGVRWDNG